MGRSRIRRIRARRGVVAIANDVARRHPASVTFARASARAIVAFARRATRRDAPNASTDRVASARPRRDVRASRARVAARDQARVAPHSRARINPRSRARASGVVVARRAPRARARASRRVPMGARGRPSREIAKNTRRFEFLYAHSVRRCEPLRIAKTRRICRRARWTTDRAPGVARVASSALNHARCLSRTSSR